MPADQRQYYTDLKAMNEELGQVPLVLLPLMT